MSALLLPNWFIPWGLVGIGAIVLLLVLIIVIIVVSSKKKAAQKDNGQVNEAKSEPVVKETAPADSAKAQEEKPVEKAEPKQAAKTESKPVEKAEDKTTTKTEEKKVANSEPKKEVSKTKTYHISKRKDDNKWQVKAAGSEKALKLFNTQAEAIEYAKKVAGNQEANIMVHKEDGSFRKLTY